MKADKYQVEEYRSNTVDVIDPYGDSFDIEDDDTYTVTRSHKYGRRVMSECSKHPSGSADNQEIQQSTQKSKEKISIIPFLMSKAIFYFCAYHFIKWITADKPNPEITAQGVIVYVALFIVLPFALSEILRNDLKERS